MVNPNEILSKHSSHKYLILLENQLDWIKIVDVTLFSIYESVSHFSIQALLTLIIVFWGTKKNENTQSYHSQSMKWHKANNKFFQILSKINISQSGENNCKY